MLQKLGEQFQNKLTIGGGARRWIGSIGIAVAIGIAYFLAARLGLALLADPERVAVFWPAAGVAAGTLVALGRWARAPVAVAVMVATVAANLMGDRGIWAALSFALCNTGEALFAAWLIERFFGPHFSLHNLRMVLGLLASAAVASAAAGVAAAAAMSLFGPSAAPMLSVWWDWFVSDALGIIIVAPLLIGLAAAARDAPSWHESIEGTLALVMLAATSQFALGLMSGPCATIASVTVLFPLLLWLGARCRPVFAAAGVFVVAAVIVWTTTYGHHTDSSMPIAHRMLDAQVAILASTLTALTLAALFTERRRNEARLLSILDAANVIAWDADPSRDTVRHIGPIARFSDKPGGLQIKDWATFAANIFPDDRDRVLVKLRTAIRRRASFCTEFRVPLSDSGVRWVAVEGTAERDKDGRALSMRGVTRDITERKKAELALAERNLQLALAGKAALVGSFAYDLDTERMQISEGYAAIHGFPDGTTEIARSEWRLGVHPEDRVRWEALRSRAYRERWDEYSGEYRIVRSGSEYRWIEARVFVSYDGDGRPRRAVGVDIDVTARKRAEEQQDTLNAELDHRVKNVLATVSAIAAHTKAASSSMDDFVAALDGRIRSMATTHELLSARRWHGVSLTELVRRELAPYATRNNTEIGGPEVTLSAEAGQVVSMVLHELTTNAAKHGALSVHDGQVSVHWHGASNGNADAPIAIEWQETGGPAVQAPDTCGYGMEVIRDVIPYELRGRVDLSFPTDGLCCRLEIPAEWLSNGTRTCGTVNGAGQPLHGVS